MPRIGTLFSSCILTALLATAAAGQCSKPAPPAELAASIDWVWNNRIRSTVVNQRNTIVDQVFADAAKGKLNFCVRWDSDEAVSAAKRDQFEPMLHRQMNHWFKWLKGYDCWPYDTIPIKVTGWAVVNRSTLQWTDAESPAPVYVGSMRENAPQCPETCGRFFHKEKNYAYPSCPGGAAKHYDMSSWHTKGFSGGHGSDWGQRTNSSSTLSSVTSNTLMIILHEMGHGFYLPDFYNAADMPPGGLPPAIMQAGRASNITDWDGWMLRRVWSELKAQSGRIVLPQVSVDQPPKVENRISVFAEQGRIMVRPRGGSGPSLRVEVFDLSGRLVASASIPEGMQETVSLGRMTGSRNSVYLVKIASQGPEEIHRVSVL